MTIESKENQDSQAPKEIALRLRQQDTIIVSPIDLSLENVKTINAEQIQWLNFYEPPLRLTLSNGGDTVMIRGQWSNRQQRPTLFGGPLDGNYVFSQAHFHWDSPSHVHTTHTINGKSNSLEMHALFYKTNYHTQGEAQEKEDGIIIVVYFFKVEERSSFKWMTDQLEQVMAPKSTSDLPPAPLCALMVPFTGDYLAYWGALACTCHHVLWLVSRTPLRITKAELERFGKVQSIVKEKINNENIKPVKTTNNVYQINSSNGSLEVLFPDAIDPPCQISTTPSKISIAVEYLKIMTSNKTANSVSGGDVKRETCCEVSLENCTPQGRDLSTSDSETKNKSQSNESNDQPLCSMCKIRTAHVNKLNRKLSRKRCVVSKRNTLQSERIANVGKTKVLEKERKKKGVELCTREIEAARELLEKEKEEIQLTKKALDDESKRLAETCGSKETPNDGVVLKRLVETSGSKETPNTGVLPKRLVGTNGSKETPNTGVLLKRLVGTNGSKETPNGGVVDETNSCPIRRRSPIQKSVLTSKPKMVLVEKNNSHCQRENVEANSKLTPGDQGESPKNAQSEATGDQNIIKEEKGIKLKVEPPKGPPKSKLPVRKFTPWRPQEGLKSSLSPYFSSPRGRSPTEKKPDSPGNSLKMSTQIPKYNKRIVNRTKYPQRQDLGGKGDQNTRIGQQRPMGHMVSINYL